MDRRTLVLLVLWLAAGCKRTSPAADAGVVDSCVVLFGNPTDQTGLDSTQCQPQCSCNGSVFRPPVYSAAFMRSLIDDWQLMTPYPPLAADPYAAPVPPDDPDGTVCAVLEGDAAQEPRPYTLVTYGSEAAARAAGAHVTHFGHCGVCSTLANLAVYMQENDLTQPVRGCAISNGAYSDADAGAGDIACLQTLGFDLPCAQIWAYNSAHTRQACLAVCLDNITASYNLADGTLNPCLQCDEDMSGPVFKAVAGRTRRNSGLPNAICRPCSQVQPLVHSY